MRWQQLPCYSPSLGIQDWAGYPWPCESGPTYLRWSFFSRSDHPVLRHQPCSAVLTAKAHWSERRDGTWRSARTWSQGLSCFNRQWHSNLVLFCFLYIDQNYDSASRLEAFSQLSAPGQLRLVCVSDCIIFWLPSFSGYKLLLLLHFPHYRFRR